MATQITNNQTVVTDALWQTYLPLIDNGSINDIVILAVHHAIIGDYGMNILCARFAHIIQAPTMVTIDARGIHHIHAKMDPHGRHSVSDEGTVKPKPSTGNKGKVAPVKLPRPPNSFILYRQRHHPDIKAEHPELHNNEISSILGKQWQNESDAVKDEFRALAEKIKRQHFLEHPDYQYRPRKPSQKKRRMTRRKAVALAALSSESSTAAAAVTVAPPVAVQAAQAPTSQHLAGMVAQQANTITDIPSSSALPVMEFTPEGNALFSLGADDFETMDLEQMLEDYNATMPSTVTNTNQVMVPGGTPVLHNELCQDAQDDFNFFSEFVHFEDGDDFINEAELMGRMVNELGTEDKWAAVAPNVAAANFDALNVPTQDTELFRTYTDFE